MGSRKERKQRRQKKVEKEEEMEHDLEAMEKLLNEDNSSDDDDNDDVDEKDDGSTASESLPSGQEDSDSNDQDEDSGDNEEEEMEVESLKSPDDDEEEEGHPVEDESMDGDDENEDGEEEEEESASEDDEDEDEEPQDSISSPLENNTNLQDEKCSFDIRNLTVIDPHQVNTNSLYKSTKKKKKKSTSDDDEIYTISTPGIDKVNEEYLLEKASEGCSQLLEELWNLDMENAIATLPSYCTTTIPRSLPPPKPREPTRWEKFAQERGIQSKSKKSRKVWDELTQSWKHLTGYNASSSADPQSWPIMEVKRNDDPYEDPWQRVRDEKKDKMDKQSAARMRNQERAGLIDKGTATRTVKAKKAARDAGREGGAKDVDWKTTHANQNNKSTPVGIPKDLQPGQQRGKEMTNLALLATQRSTASMGKFDQMREGEPERNKATGIKKRKYESGTASSSVKNEMKKSLKVLDNVLTGGGKEKERAVRRGEYSKGTTGYDYEYDDDSHRGFKKKKGRAGAGKMRKMTKKRAK